MELVRSASFLLNPREYLHLSLKHKSFHSITFYCRDQIKHDNALIPTKTGRVRKGEKSSQPVSMGACQEFMPVVLRFLHSDRDEHLHIALVMVRGLKELVSVLSGSCFFVFDHCDVIMIHFRHYILYAFKIKSMFWRIFTLWIFFVYIRYNLSPSQVQSLLERFWDQLLQMSRNHLTSCQSANLESLYMILVTTVERVRQLTSWKSPEVSKEASAAYTLLEKLWE